MAKKKSGRYAVFIKERKRPLLIIAKSNNDAKKWARKTGFTPTKAHKLITF